MNRFLLSLLLFISISPAIAQDNSVKVKAQFKSLHWLAGNWERTNPPPGHTAMEKWELTSPSEFKGFGITMEGSDTVFLEKIQLKITDGDIYYIADVVENKEPVHFKLTEITPRGFVCQNQEHDFPKKIEYILKDKTLKVLISGDGKSQDFFFARR